MERYLEVQSTELSNKACNKEIKENTSEKRDSNELDINLNKNYQFIDNFNQSNIKVVKNLVDKKIQSLIILRGPPGSGKSYLAKQVKFNGIIVSSDDYFTKNGVYKFDSFKLTDAHNYCRIRVNEAFKKGVSPIIIDNTNSRIWELQPYIKLALKQNYHVEILQPSTPWFFNARELANKNKHNVKLSSIKKHLDEFEKIDFKMLIEQSKYSLDINPKSKTGDFITNFNEILDKNEWNGLYSEEKKNESTKADQNKLTENYNGSLLNFNLSLNSNTSIANNVISGVSRVGSLIS